MTPDYGKSFAAWRAATREWEGFVRHPFVEGLRHGDLPRGAFLRYLEQDYLFLIHFTRAWALAAVKAGSLDEMRLSLKVADALANDEMRLHVETCAREGISPAELEAAAEAPETLAYTRYVIDAGLSGDFLDLMAALAPCVLGYGEIGARLAAETGPDAPYAEWIGTYAGEDYQDLCRTVGAAIDAAAAARIGERPTESPRWAALTRRFADATRLETAFWEMGLRGGA